MSELSLPACPICHAPNSLSRETMERAGQAFTWYECQECGSVLLWLGDDQWAYQKIAREDKAYLLKQPMTERELRELLPSTQEVPGMFSTAEVRLDTEGSEQAEGLTRNDSRRGKPTRLLRVGVAVTALVLIIGIVGLLGSTAGWFRRSALLGEPTTTPTPAPAKEVFVDTNRLEDILVRLFGEKASGPLSSGELHIIVDTEPLGFLGDELQGIELAEKAESCVYTATYHLFAEFDQVDAIVAEVRFNGDAAYRVRVTKKEAYAIQPGYFRDGADYPSIDPAVLAAVAQGQNLASTWDVQYLALEIQEAIASPSLHDVTAVVQNWTKADIMDITVEPQAIFARLDISRAASVFYDIYGRKDPRAREQVTLESALTTVDTVYGLFVRFGHIQEITITVYVDGNEYAAHQCVREELSKMGLGIFNLGGPEEDPVAILEVCQSP